MSISGEDFPQISPDPSQTATPICTPSITPTSTPSITTSPTSSVEMIYIESDDVNPSHVHYEKGSAIVVNEDIIEEIKRDFTPKKSFLRNVRNSKRRHT
jgi:hypothetical protein